MRCLRVIYTSTAITENNPNLPKKRVLLSSHFAMDMLTQSCLKKAWCRAGKQSC